jgi:oligopeptide transport system ATP-binding protein
MSTASDPGRSISASTGEALLELRGITKTYRGRRHHQVTALDDVSFRVPRGQVTALVGESGSGKSTAIRCILGLETPDSGEIQYKGQRLAARQGSLGQARHREIQVVFQDPTASLNPRMTAADLITEGLIVHGLAQGRAELARRGAELMRLVGLDPESGGRRPRAFSGGQRQRIAIARALALSPKLVVLDEPVSALDVSIRAQILNLLRDLQAELGLSYLFIAHDLAAVAHMSHTILVMYLGKIVESGEARALARAPKHPYTEALFSAALPSHPDERREEIILPGEVPSPLNPPAGCRFHPRCPHAMACCSEEEPMLADIEGRRVACHLYDREVRQMAIEISKVSPVV